MQRYFQTCRRSRRSFGPSVGILFVPAVVLLLLLALSCKKANQGAQNTNPIRIGAVLPLTGNSSAWGDQGKKGIELAIREFNQAGGVGGRQVEAIFEDSQAQPRLAVTAFNKLSQADGVPAVVGDVVSATTLAMAPLAQERKVVLVGISSSAPALTQAGDFIYRVWPSDNEEGRAAADWAHSQGYRKVSILHIATDYGQGLAAVFRTSFEAHGGNVVSVQSYGQDQTDFRSYLARIKSASPDAVYLIGYYKDSATALRQARETGLSTRFIGATAVESPDLLRLAGEAAEGLVYPTILDFDPENPTVRQKDFIENFRTAFGRDPDWVSSHSHDAALVILETLKSGAKTGDEIRRAIDSQRTFEGVTGTIRFDENGDVVGKPVIMKTVRGGAFTVLNAPKPLGTRAPAGGAGSER